MHTHRKQAGTCTNPRGAHTAIWLACRGATHVGCLLRRACVKTPPKSRSRKWPLRAATAVRCRRQAQPLATCTQASVRAARRYRVRCACLPLPVSVRLQRHQQAAARLPIARRAERRPFSSLEGCMQVLMKAVGERIVESRSRQARR